ncbi:MAG: hypothetical protein GY940_04340, partial [bacterium]|nr:hypothetical protein [bacterium]
HDSDFFHPDLIAASDTVIGKPGYSTVAEVFQSGVPFGYVTRENFRESQVMDSFIKDQMSGFPVPESRFHSGAWLKLLPELLSGQRIERGSLNGADQAANFIAGIL